MSIKKLTRAEEELMLVLWKLDKAFLKDIVNAYNEPRPSQSTISTLLRTLERKGFAAHKAYSKTFEYYTLLSKRNYQRALFRDFVHKYMDGSQEELVRFLVTEANIELHLPDDDAEKERQAETTGEAFDRKQLSLF